MSNSPSVAQIMVPVLGGLPEDMPPRGGGSKRASLVSPDSVKAFWQKLQRSVN